MVQAMRERPVKLGAVGFGLVARDQREAGTGDEYLSIFPPFGLRGARIAPARDNRCRTNARHRLSSTALASVHP
jgi:hypothetical protein